jgi:DNA polymerase-1
MLVKIIGQLKPDYIVAAYDLPGPTYRHDAYEDYKATRVKTDEALVAQIIRSRDVMKGLGIPMYDAKGFEADDVIGTIVEETKGKKDLEVVIASGDMDALQLVDGKRVQVFTMRKGLNDTVLYDEDGVKAQYGFGPEAVPDYKGIAGDPSDNIKGVVGVGKGSAVKLLQLYGSIKGVYAAIKKLGVEKVASESGVQKRFIQLVADNKESAEFSKELATIRRDAPIDFKIPEHIWREGIKEDEVLTMLAEFDFRSLMPRIKELLAGGKVASTKIKEFISPEEADREEVEAPQGEGLFGDEKLPPEAEDLAIAVSVLDSNIAQPTLSDIYRMGRSKNIEEARKHILSEIKDKKLEFVYEKIELPLAPVLRKMEKRGVKVDRAFLKDLSKQYSKELKKISERIYKAAGGEFNIASPKQLGDVLYDKLALGNGKIKKTAGGARSTKESELVKMRDQHPIIDDILSYRELSKLLSTYIDTLPTLLDKEDRVHTTFLQVGAGTGRIASIDPNLQNIPIKTDLGRAIRKAFVADKGYKLVSFDYSQIELRIAAMLSKDKSLADIFITGRDVHTEVAARVFHVKEKDVTYEMRRRAKVINFGILYGMGVNALREALDTNRSEAQEFYNQYFEAFPRLAAYVEESKADASRLGYTETFFGRRRYLDGIKSPIPYVRASAERVAINAPIQGTQADLVKLAMVKIQELLMDEVDGDACMLLQVHDELVFEIKESRIKALLPKIKAIMESVMNEKERQGIPFKAEAKVGQNWGDMKHIDL